MTAQIAGFVSRADAGLRGPRSVSKNITPQNGGVAVHYGGPAQPAAQPGSDHALCVRTWRNWQNYHMNTHGWSDIAYTGGFCNHGFAFAGRGAGVRTAANGTNTGNQNFYAVTWIGGEGQTPSQQALDAADWWIHTLRTAGANVQVRPHRFFKSTGCPGDPLVGYAASRHQQHVQVGGAPAPAPTPAPTSASTKPTPDREMTKRIQLALEIKADGLWGSETDARALMMRNASRSGASYHRTAGANVRTVQSIVDATVDGAWGPRSVEALGRWVRGFQAWIGVGADGAWGPKTDARFMAIRAQNLNNF